MDILLGFLIEVIGEVIVQLVFELFIRIVVGSFFEFAQNTRLGATIASTLLGALSGALSVLIFPHYFVSDPSLRVLNLMLTPTAVGSTMAFLGRRREKKGRTVIGLDKFSYGFCFAFFMALTRLKLAA